jgi:hypothetical protein
MLTEDVGLAQMGRRIDRLFNNRHFARVSGGYLSADVSGSQPTPLPPLEIPDTDFQIPQISRQGRIMTLHRHRTPIYIQLSDGTEANFTWDEFKRIKGEPKVGKVMTITFQRHPGDQSGIRSKIDSAEVTD